MIALFHDSHKFLYFLFATCFCILSGAVSEAAVVVTVSPVTQTVVQGGDVVFNIFVGPSGGAVVIDAIDMNIVAGPGDGTAGVFTSGPTFLLGSDPFDVLTDPGQAFSTNFQIGGVNFDEVKLYGTLTLSTVGVAEGTYQLSMNSLSANNPVTGPASIQFTQDVFYNVTAVPEPSSFLLLGATGVAMATRYRRRQLRLNQRSTLATSSLD